VLVTRRERLLHRVEVRDNVGAVLLLLEARERHVGALDVLLRVGEVVEHGLVGPGDTRALVGLRVLEAGDLTRLAADHTEQVGALLVGAALVARVARCALGLEDLGAGVSLAIIGTRTHGFEVQRSAKVCYVRFL